MLDAVFQEVGIRPRAAICLSCRGILDHQAAPLLLGLAPHAWGIWYDNALLFRVIAPIALRSPVSSKSIERTAIYLDRF
jgi:hypothetical protein